MCKARQISDYVLMFIIYEKKNGDAWNWHGWVTFRWNTNTQQKQQRQQQLQQTTNHKEYYHKDRHYILTALGYIYFNIFRLNFSPWTEIEAKMNIFSRRLVEP